MVGERIKNARLANCLSLQQMADRMKPNGITLTKTTLFNYENGTMVPSPTIMEVIARVLGVNLCYFDGETPEGFCIRLMHEPSTAEARKQEVLSYIQLQLEQFMLLSRINKVNLCDRLTFFTKYPVRTPDDAELASESIRARLQLGSNCISSVSSFLEENGFLILSLPKDFPWQILSGIEESTGIHFFIVSQEYFQDDLRLQLLMEFGRFVLEYPAEKENEILKRFAASMLMPKGAVLREFGESRSYISDDEMRMAKQRYGLSRTVMLSRLDECGILSKECTFLLRQELLQNYFISRTAMHYVALNFFEQPSFMLMLVKRAISEKLIQSEDELYFKSSTMYY